MNSLQTWQGDSALEQHIEQALAHSLQNMQAAALVTKAGMTEISRVHRYASDKCAVTVAAAHHLVEATQCARDISSHQQAALTHLTETYLQKMLLTTEETAAAVVEALLRI